MGHWSLDFSYLWENRPKNQKSAKKIVTTPILGDSSLFPIKTFPTQFFCILWQVMKRFTDKTTSCTHGSHTVDIVDCYFVKSEKIVTEKWLFFAIFGRNDLKTW